MRRIGNLQNGLYKKKYKQIYELIFKSDLDEVSDHSYWYKENKSYVEAHKPLWIIAESKIINKRIWITEEFGELSITTASLDLDTTTNEYSKSHTRESFNTQKEMAEYLKELLEPCLEEQKDKNNEDIKFNININDYKEAIRFARERAEGFYSEKSNDKKYITLKEVGNKHSKKLANIMFDLGYGEWVFHDEENIETMQNQIIEILEDDKDLNELLEERNITREQLYKQIKPNFIEEELAKYLEDNNVDIGTIPEVVKNDMIQTVKKGMIDNYSYKYIIWDSGDLESAIEALPENCFISENAQDSESSEEER